MKKDTKTMLLEILNSFNEIDFINTNDIPDLPLYMDQVTTFMDEKLSSGKRYADDKILTKTMINNYSKNHLLPPSDKKKYSKEHVIVMTLIYYLKSFLSIKYIETLLVPITDKYFQHPGSLNMVSIYNELLEMEKERLPYLTKEIVRAFSSAEKSAKELPCDDPDEQEYLTLFSFLCNLSFDVYLKKMLMQHMLDTIALETENDKKKGKANKKKK